VALGSNLGDRVAHLRHGVARLADGHLGHVIAESQVFETDPVGGPDDQGPYLNMVVLLETGLAPHDLLDGLLAVERERGRVREVRWGPRTLDLDIVFFDDLVIHDDRLTLPHPRHGERRFVLEPLAELAPDRCPPRWRETVPEMGIYPRGPLADMITLEPPDSRAT
jgi:2-amino-4-hydroxy-6-hydroxymethyldihydropteridine diphosphokinase